MPHFSIYFFVPECVISQNVLKTPVIVLAPQKRRSDPLWHGCASRVVPRSPRGHHLTQVSMPNPAWCFFAYSSYLFLVYWAGHLPCLLKQLLRRRHLPSPPPSNWGGLKTTCSPLPVRFASAGGTWQWPDVQPLLGTVWIIYLLNLALAWHFDVWRLEAPALTI